MKGIIMMQNDQATKEEIQSNLNNRIKREKDLRNALLLIHSDKYKLHWKFAAGTTGSENNPISADNPYYVASIGKTFTSLIVARLHERRLLDYNDHISKYLSSEMLSGLFVYGGKDYSRDVLIRQLLNHTSGIGDYFEDKPIKGNTIKELAIDEPQRFWRPEDTIDYTRQNQKAISAPGTRFHYSDTGYNLLGKIIEKITDKPFHENLHNEIFEPLGMENSYFLFYSEPKKRSLGIADVFFGKNEISTYKSLSIDWAGGGIVSTAEDLLLFQQALVKNTLIRRETFSLCLSDIGKFRFGMDYGYGILLLNIGQMTFILPKRLNMWGNFGFIAAYMFYNPEYDTYIIGSFNHSNYIIKQVFFLIEMIRKVSKLYRK